jgi:hypothetical protein
MGANQPGVYEVGPASKTTSSLYPAAGNTLDGAGTAVITYNTADIQKWSIEPI